MTFTLGGNLLPQNKRMTYQNFAAGEIVSTSVTLSKNQNGQTASGGNLNFIASNIDSTAPLIVLQSDYESPVNDSSNNKVKVVSINNNIVTLSAIPVNNVAVAIWYQYLEPEPSIVKNSKQISPNIENNRIIEVTQNKISKISNPTTNDIAKINSDGEIENSNIQADDVVTKIIGGTDNNIVTRDGSGDIQDGGKSVDELLTQSDIVDNVNSNDSTKVFSAKQGRINSLRITNAENVTATKVSKDLSQEESTIFVNPLKGADSRNGLNVDTAKETLGAGWGTVTSSGQVKALGASTVSVNHTFASTLTSVKTTLDSGFKVNGTINLVNGNTSMYFYDGMMGATINDSSAGTVYINNTNLGGATLNFSGSGYKTIRGSTSAPTLINLTGSGGTLYLENISGGVININIGSGWTVYTVNSLLNQITNNGIVSDANSTIVSSVIADQTALAGIVSSGAVGLFALNFANPSITGLSGLTKGDIIYKVGALHFRSYSFIFAPATISVVKTATEQNSYHKEGDEWVLTKSKLDPVPNGTANHLVSQGAGGELEPTTINKNDVALIDPNATANNIPKFNSNGHLIDGGIAINDINNQRAIWAYQDFNAGAITGTSVTLTTGTYTEISGSDFNAAKIISSAFIVRSDNIKKYAYSGAIELFSSKIKVSNISGASVTLSNAPHSSYPIRIYFQYSFNGFPEYYSPIKSLSASALDELNPIIATQEEVDEKLSKNNNLNDVDNNQTARNNLLGSGNTNDVIKRNSSGNWVASAGGGGISDAPSNGLIYSRQYATWVPINIPTNSSGSVNPENSNVAYGKVGDIFTDSLTGNSYYKSSGNNTNSGWKLITKNNDLKSYLTTSQSAYNSASNNTWVEVTNDEYSAILQNERMYVIGTPLETITVYDPTYNASFAKLTLQKGTKGAFYFGGQVTVAKDDYASVFEKTKFYGFRIHVNNYSILASQCRVKCRVGNYIYDVGSYLPGSSKTNDYANFILKNPSQIFNMPYLAFMFRNINYQIHYQISTNSGFWTSGDSYSISSMSVGYDFGIEALVSYV